MKGNFSQYIILCFLNFESCEYTTYQNIQLNFKINIVLFHIMNYGSLYEVSSGELGKKICLVCDFQIKMSPV